MHRFLVHQSFYWNSQWYKATNGSFVWVHTVYDAVSQQQQKGGEVRVCEWIRRTLFVFSP